LLAAAGCETALETSLTSNPASWTTEETIPGTALSVTRHFALRDQPPSRFFRLRCPTEPTPPIVHRDLPHGNTLMFEDFNSQETGFFTLTTSH
jgi:hypothetical protein